jgi:cholesterol transport system auxiliary component
MKHPMRHARIRSCKGPARASAPIARPLIGSLAMLAFCAMGLSSCALPGRTPTPPTATYVLNATAERGSCQGSYDAPTRLPLKIATPTAAPAFASAQMAYIETPYRIDHFADNEWVDTPARMLKPLLSAYLVDCGMFGFTYADGAGIDGRLRLDSEILELVQVFDPSSSEVRVSIRFTLVDTQRRDAILAQTISATEATTSRDPYGGVVAANAALQRVLAQLVQAMRVPVANLTTETAPSS